MKKLIACLLGVAVLCMPFSGLAEAVCTTVTFQADADGIAPVITHVTGDENTNLSSGIAQLLNSVSMSMSRQEQAVELQFSLKDEEIIRLTSKSEDGQTALLCSLLPDYVLTTDILPQMDCLAFLKEAAALDFSGIAEETAWCVDTFLASADYMEEEGSFAGDAYSNGVRRQTLRLDDRDLSLLLDCILTSLACDQEFAALCERANVDLAAAVLDARLTLQDAALVNAYDYQVSAVYDENDVLIGLSGTAMQGERQIATLSIGIHDRYVEIVWGYGTGGVNYYIRAIVLVEESEDGSVGISGLVDVLTDPTGLGYGLVSTMETMLLEEHVLTLTLAPSEQAVVFEGGIRSTMNGAAPAEMTLMFSGQQAEEDGDMTLALYWDAAEEPALLMNVQSETIAEVSVETEGLKVVSLDDMSEEERAVINNLLEDAAAELGVKLFKLLPAGLMWVFMQ